MVGKGNTAEVFEYGVQKVCKLFYEEYPREYVELEYKNAKEVFSLKLNIPKPYEIITIGKRHGIVYEKIEGKLLASLFQEQQSDRDRLLDEFVRVHQKFLSKHTQNVLSYKYFLIALLKSKKIENPPLVNDILALPEGDCLLHGDFHPENILVKSEHIPIVIDFMNVCHGPAAYDIARTYFILKCDNSTIADSYLYKMNIEKSDITQYLKVIEACRKYESE